MSKYLGYEQTGFANSTVNITRASSGTSLPINYDNIFGDTVLYLPFDSDINDASSFNHTITSENGAVVSDTILKYGAGSLRVEDDPERITVTDDGNFNFGTQDFTIEGWFRFTEKYGPARLIHGGNNSSSIAPFLFYLFDDAVGFYSSSDGSNWDISNNKRIADIASTDTWYHLAVTREGDTFRTFQDGTLKTTFTSSGSLMDVEDGAIAIGGRPTDLQSLNGYIDDLRIIKGHAKYTASFTAPTSAVGLYSGNPVSLYLPFDSDVNDDSSHSHTVTASGSATISSTQAKFGGNSLSLNGTSQYLTVPNNNVFDFGSEDFTIEMWIYMTSNAGSSAGDRHALVARRDGSSNRSFHVGIQLDGGQQKLQFSHSTTGSGGSQTNYNTDIQLNTWTHVAIVRSRSKVYAFVDGVKNGSEHSIGTNTIFAGTSDLTIGYRAESSQYFPGYIDDLRISKGVARYTKSFVPPSQAVGATLNGANETNTTTDFTSLYLPFDSDVNDDSSHSHSVTASGDAAISSTQAKFGGNSLSLDGTDDYLQIADNAAFEFGKEDWTLETWFYQNDNTGHIIAQKRNTSGTWGTGAWTLGVNTNYGVGNEIVGRIEFFSNEFNTGSPLLAYEKGSEFSSGWHHLALTRSGGDWRLFLDGSVVASATWTGTMSDASYPLTIGRDTYAGAGQRGYLNGYLDDFRILKGYAKYTADFTPPTSAVGTSVSETVNDLTVLYMPFDSTETTNSVAASQTSLYLPFDSDTNDDSAQSHTVTNNGVTISSAQSKFGGYSALFDGTNDYLVIPSDSSLVFGDEDFTVEFFIYANDNTLQSPFTHRDGSAGAGDWTIPLNRTVAGQIEWYNGDYSVTSAVVSTTISGGFSGAWHHIAITRSGDTHRIFFDGELKASATNSSTYSSGPTELHIGRDNYVGGRYYFDGYLDDIRIIKGTALYKESFTVPTSALGATGTAISVAGGFEDQARNNGVTTAGTAALNTSVKKFGTSSLFVDGNSDYVAIPDTSFIFGTNDFTVEAFVYHTGVSTTANIFDFRNGSNDDGFTINMDTSGNVGYYSNKAGGYLISQSGNSIGSNSWKHLVLCRHDGTIRLFIDGTLKASASDTYDYGSLPLVIGARFSEDQQYFAGYIDDLRVIQGHAVYTEAFTPPTSAHGHVSLETSSSTSETYSDTKFLSGVWNLRDAESKIQDGEWVRNDSDTGSVPSGLIIKGAGLEVEGHRWYTVTEPPAATGIEILAVGAGGDGGNNQKSGGNTVFTQSVTGEYILAVGGGSAGPAGGGVGRSGGGGGGFVTATDLELAKDVSYTLTVGASGAVTESPLPSPSPAYPGGSGGGGTYVGSGVNRAGGTGVQPSTPQPLISGIPGASNFQNLGYDGGTHNGPDNPGSDNGPGRGGGGLGTSSSITGSSQTYAGGGYSGNRGGNMTYLSNPGPGGSSNRDNGNGGPGTRGGGGGGAGAFGSTGGSGGPGVFVIAYPDTENTLSITGTLSYSQPSRSGYRVYYFTGGTGTITLPS